MLRGIRLLILAIGRLLIGGGEVVEVRWWSWGCWDIGIDDWVDNLDYDIVKMHMCGQICGQIAYLVVGKK